LRKRDEQLEGISERAPNIVLLEPNLLFQVVERGPSFVSMNDDVWVIARPNRIAIPAFENLREGFVSPSESDIAVSIRTRGDPRVALRVYEDAASADLSLEDPDLGQVSNDKRSHIPVQFRLQLLFDVFTEFRQE